MGGLDRNDWEEITESRNVSSVYLTHLIRGNSDECSYRTLVEILKSGKLKSGFSERNGYRTVEGDEKVVCFQNNSFDAMREIISGEKWCNDFHKYRKFGIMFRRDMLYNAGAKPVLYGQKHYLKGAVKEELHWLIVNLELCMNYIDWTHEHEWRIVGDVNLFNYEPKIIVSSNEYKRQLLNEESLQGSEYSKILTDDNVLVFDEECLNYWQS